MKSQWLFVLILFLVASCKQVAENEASRHEPVMDHEVEFIDHHTAKLSLDYHGTYHGVLPCADCPGIETTIHLHEDGTYEIIRKYLDRGDDAVFRSSGVFSWDARGFIITLEGETPPNQYFVAENHLRQRDIHGEEITGELASMYFLHKILDD